MKGRKPSEERAPECAQKIDTSGGAYAMIGVIDLLSPVSLRLARDR